MIEVATERKLKLEDTQEIGLKVYGLIFVLMIIPVVPIIFVIPHEYLVSA